MCKQRSGLPGILKRFFVSFVSFVFCLSSCPCGASDAAWRGRDGRGQRLIFRAPRQGHEVPFDE
jgi:hypothetical protein